MGDSAQDTRPAPTVEALNLRLGTASQTSLELYASEVMLSTDTDDTVAEIETAGFSGIRGAVPASYRVTDTDAIELAAYLLAALHDGSDLTMDTISSQVSNRMAELSTDIETETDK